MQLAYHAKHSDGWHHIITAPIDDKKAWNDQDIWAFNFMIDNGTRVVTMGYTMWQLIED
jgi:hypothetical protein